MLAVEARVSMVGIVVNNFLTYGNRGMKGQVCLKVWILSE